LLALILLVIGLAIGGVFSTGPLVTPSSARRHEGKPPPTTRRRVVAVPVPTVTLKPGDHNPSVKSLQRALTSLGYSPGGADGQYGAGTRRALMNFQQAHHLTADGVLGPATLAAIKRALRR
jgi:peptidoglycan hydrolase-like protein with peptidoglycan-binding domain